MPIIVEKYGLAYFSIPKVACTSIKHVLFELEHGHPFEPGEKTGKKVHAAFPPAGIQDGDFERCASLWTFAVFRDPIKRILSAYSNRVLYHEALKRISHAPMIRLKARLAGISLNPDLNEFCVNLPKYQKLSREIRHHTRPYATCVGDDISRLDATFPLEKLNELAAELSRRTGKEITFPRLQTGGPKFTIDDLSPGALSALRRFTAPDYELLGGMYSPPPAKA